MDTGLGSAIMQGMQAGEMLGDRIAALRSNNRMQDLQDQISSGAYDPSKFNGDQAAAQQALQDAVRQATAPLSSRGLDSSYGGGQYGRLQDLISTRYNQQGADLVNQGDVAGGARRGAQASAVLGNLPGAIQAGQFASNVDAGNSAIASAGDGSGLAPGQVNQQKLASGVAQGAARYGDVSGAAQAGGQEQGQRDALVQRNLGQAMTLAMNPALGGMDAAAGHLNAAAQLAGYGGVMRDNNDGTYWVVDKQNKPVPGAQITPSNIQQFAQTIGNDPSNIMPALRAAQGQAAADQRDWQKTVNTKALDSALSSAGKAGDPTLLRAVMSEARSSAASAKAGGWDIVGQGQDINDAKGNPTGKAYLVKNEATGQPMRMIVSGAGDDDPNAPPAITLTDYQGRPIDPNTLPAKAAASIALAQKAVADQAKADYLQLSAQQGAMQQQGIETIRRSYLGQPASPGSFMLPGQQPPSAMGASPQAPGASPLAPQGNTAWEQNARNYKSPLVAVDNAQMLAESGGNPNATSPAGAHGLMQIMPATARELEKRLGMPEGEIDRNPAANYYAGRVYRDSLYKDAMAKTGDPALSMQYALSAFNAGPGGVNAAANRGKLPAETSKYVPKVMKGSGAMSGGAPQAKISGKDAAPIQARNASLATNADRFLLGR